MTNQSDEIERNRNNALLILAQTEEIRKLTIDRDAWKLTAKTFARAYEIESVLPSTKRES